MECTTTVGLTKIVHDMGSLADAIVVPVHIARRMHADVPCKLAHEFLASTRKNLMAHKRFVVPHYSTIAQRWSVFVLDTAEEPGVTHVYHMGVGGDDAFVDAAVKRLKEFMRVFTDVPDKTHVYCHTTRVPTESNGLLHSALLAFFYMRSWGLKRDELVQAVTPECLEYLHTCFCGHS